MRTKKTVAANIRWRVARVLNLLPSTCWVDIVQWALDGRKVHGRGPGAVRNFGATCRRESRTHRDRSCYCGKFRAPDFEEEVPA